MGYVRRKLCPYAARAPANLTMTPTTDSPRLSPEVSSWSATSPMSDCKTSSRRPFLPVGFNPAARRRLFPDEHVTQSVVENWLRTAEAAARCVRKGAQAPRACRVAPMGLAAAEGAFRLRCSACIARSAPVIGLYRSLPCPPILGAILGSAPPHAHAGPRPRPAPEAEVHAGWVACRRPQLGISRAREGEQGRTNEGGHDGRQLGDVRAHNVCARRTP